MKIKLVTIQNNKNAHIDALVEDFLKRIKHILPFECLVLNPSKKQKFEDKKKLMNIEAKMLLSQFALQDYVVLLDENGKDYSSIQFAKKLEKLLHSTRGSLFFVIGGAYGFSSEIYDRANEKISMSSMTLTHQMARLFFVEQFYRGLSILKNLPYHHQ